MKISDIREIAGNRGIKADKKANKIELIRAIQRTEGNSDCFATAYVLECNQFNCLWREDCKKEDSKKAAQANSYLLSDEQPKPLLARMQNAGWNVNRKEGKEDETVRDIRDVAVFYYYGIPCGM
jgi:secreted Zn-dependent insulinase-like peptidase